MDTPWTACSLAADGLLYVSSQGSDEILRYDAAGTLVSAFVSGRSGGLDGPSGFAFGPDGRLYVAGRHSGNVLAYDVLTSAFAEVIVDTGDGLQFILEIVRPPRSKMAALEFASA